MDTLTPVRRGPRVTLWLLRLLITALLVGVLAQPVLAGIYLGGGVDAIVLHGTVGDSLAALSMATIVATLLYVLAGRGRVWVLPVSVVLFAAVTAQLVFGYDRALNLHVPLGVAIVIASVLLTVWVWSPSAGRAR